MQKILPMLLFILLHQKVQGQDFLEHSDGVNKNRTIGVSVFHGASWAGSVAGLQYIWYADFDKSPFHFFDDHQQWSQMDKAGHFYSAYQFARLSGDLYSWAGVSEKKAVLIGSAFSFAYLGSIELMDGYHTNWGFSWSDLGANAMGAAAYFSQFYFERDPCVHFKFSSTSSGLAPYRPSVLGNTFASQLLKDYNGQTYWASFNPFYWFQESSAIPKWVQFSVGYSVQNQLIGDGGTYIYHEGSDQLNFTPYRQYFLSLDIDFESIPTDRAWLKLVFRGLNMIKLPFPALEYSQGAVRVRPMYF